MPQAFHAYYNTLSRHAGPCMHSQTLKDPCQQTNGRILLYKPMQQRAARRPNISLKSSKLPQRNCRAVFSPM